MPLLLGIDLGTSYFKVGLFDRDLRLLGMGRVSVAVHTSGNRTCELPVDRFWQALHEGLNAALLQAGAAAGDIVSVSYASQANSFLLLDAGHQPLTPLVLWPDSRAGTIPPALAALWKRPDFLETTGLGVGPGLQTAASKWHWFRCERPEIWQAMSRVMTISDYLTFSLTGQPVGDAGTASLLGLLDQRAIAWWPQAVADAGLTPDRLSRPLRPGTVAGRVTAAGAARIGLPAGIPVVAGTLDHHAAALGAGLGTVAEVSESTGTVLACVSLNASYRPRPRLCALPGVRAGEYAWLVYDGNGAGVLEWYRAQHAPNMSFKELDRLAAVVPPGSDGLVAAPQANLKPGLDGFLNRTAAHGQGHFARAIMESTASTLGTLVDTLCPQGRPKRIVATGGGAHSPLWLQIKRDTLGIDFVAAECAEPACRGAALLAAHGLQ